MGKFHWFDASAGRYFKRRPGPLGRPNHPEVEYEHPLDPYCNCNNIATHFQTSSALAVDHNDISKTWIGFGSVWIWEFKRSVEVDGLGRWQGGILGRRF